MHKAVIVGKVRHRSDTRLFSIRLADRLHHIYAIGKTGAGKTTFIENMIRQDIEDGNGFALLDPHGDLAKRITRIATGLRRDQVHTVDLSDPGCTASYNPLTYARPELRPLIAAGLLDVFKQMWSDAWGSRMEHVLRNAILALLDRPHSTLADIQRLLTDKAFRRETTAHIAHPPVRAFWRSEFPRYSARYQADAIAPIQSKVGALLADPRLYRFFTSTDNPLRLRAIMDQGHILIVDLSKGQLGADSAALLGGVITTALALAAFSRADQAEQERRPFYLYLDEFQSFSTRAIADMLSELRKFGIGMVLAHQYLAQLDPVIRHSVLGNVGTVIAFRVGADDARALAPLFAPKFTAHDLMTLPNHAIILTLMIDGTPSRPFSAVTVAPEELKRT